MNAQEFTKRRGGKWYGDYGLVRCPAHDDSTASLSVRDGHSALLFHCFAGCDREQVVHALKHEGERAFRKPHDKTAPRENKLGELARYIWPGLRPVGQHTVAARYLASRKILIKSSALRFDPQAKFKEGGRYHEAPALVAAYHDGDELTSIQRCLLTDQGEKRQDVDPKRFLGLRNRSLCRLFPLRGDILPLAEGVEEALSVHRLRDLPCWSVGGIENYANINIPSHVRKIIVFTQHGGEARRALVRAADHLESDGRSLKIEIPKPNMDWNEMLMADERFS